MKNKQLKDKSNDEEHQSKKIDFDSLLKSKIYYQKISYKTNINVISESISY